MVKPWKAITGDDRYRTMDPNQQSEMRNRWLEKVKVERGLSSEQLSILKSRMQPGIDIIGEDDERIAGSPNAGIATPPTDVPEVPTQPVRQGAGAEGLKQPNFLQELAYGLTGGAFPDLSAEAGFAQAPNEGLSTPSPVEEWAMGTERPKALNDIIGASLDADSDAPDELREPIKEMMNQGMVPSQILDELQGSSGEVGEPDFLPGMFSPENLAGGAAAGFKIAKGMGLPVMRTMVDEMSAGLLSLGKTARTGAKGFVRGLRAGAKENNIPVSKAQDISQSVVEESIDLANRTLGGKRFPVSLPARAVSNMLPEAGGGTITPPKDLEKAQEGLRKFGKELALPGHEQTLLAKTGALKPPNMVQAPYKGKAAIMEHEALSNMNKRIASGTGRTPLRRKISAGLAELQAEVETPIRMFEKMGGNAKKMIYDPIDDADVSSVREFVDRIQPMTKKWRKMAKGKKIGNYLTGRQVGGDEILERMKIPKVTIDDLSPKERQVVTEMDEMYDELFGRINEARGASGLSPMKKVENYHTFYRQLDFLSDKLGYNPFDVADYDRTIAKHFLHPDSTFFSSAIERKGSKLPVELDAFKTFEKYTQSGLNHVYVSPQISRSRDLMKQIKKSHPENYRDGMLWLDYVAGKVPEEFIGGPITKKIANYLTRNVSMSVLSFNLRSAMIQPTALRNTLADVGPLYTTKGAYKFMEQAVNPKHRKFVNQNSNLVARKYDASVEEMLSGLSGAKRKVASIGTKPLQLFDYWTANATWNSYYFKGKDALKMSEKEAIRYANDGVVRSQASGRRTHLTKIQRTAVGKAMTGLQTFVINDWSFLTQDILGMGKNVPRNKENLKKVLYYIGGTIMANSIYEDGMNIYSPFGTPVRATVDAMKADEGWWKSLMAGSNQLMETVPLIGGSLRYGSTPLGPVAETLATGVKKLSNQEIPVEEIAKGLGVPATAQVGKTARRLKKGLSLPESIIGVKVGEPEAGVPKPPKRKKRKRPKRKRSR